MRIVIATRNTGKLNEIQTLLAGQNVELVSADALKAAPNVEEDAETLEENAAKKARVLHTYSGLASLADDTGLEVAALDNRPGVHSARYAGAQADDAANRKLLLSELADVATRIARFRTVIAFVDKESNVHFFEGICSGIIAEEERGSGGFGYDSIFIPDGLERTFAELSSAEKNAVSHRGRALRQFASFIREHD